MLTNLKEYLKPNSLKEAWKKYEENPEQTLFSTGGLSAALREEEKTQCILDLKGLLPNQIEDSEEAIMIGGNMTINEAFHSLRNHDLVQVFKKVATHQIRNMATIAGSIAQKYGWSDIITALMAYKAQVLLYNENGESKMPMEDYLKGKTPGIVLGVTIDKKYNFGIFHHITRTDYDVSQFNFYLCARVENGQIMEAGIAYGARPGYAARLIAVEEMLKDLPVNELSAKTEQILEQGRQAKVSTGFGLSQAYRQELLRVYLKRSFKALIDSQSS